jgi:PEP-CTERM motif
MSGISSRRSLLIFGRHAFEIGAFAAVMLSCAVSLAGTITPGNLVIVRAAGGPNGDASAALGGSGLAAQVFVDEYTTAGLFVQTLTMPGTANATVGGQRALTLSGTQNQEGHITLSGNGQYFVMIGYNQTANVTGTNAVASTTVERVVGRIDFNGNIDTSTALVDAISAQSPRSVYSTDGTNFWVTGNGGSNVTVNSVPNILTSGVHYAQFGVNTGGNTLSTQLNTANLTANNKYVLAAGGNLFVSNASTSSPTAPQRGVDIMSGGIATTTGQTLYSQSGFTTATANSPDDFWFFDSNTMYLADQQVNGSGGIQKWVFNVGLSTWQFQYTLGTGQLTTTATTPAAAGVHGLTGMIGAGGQAVLFGTTFDGAGANRTKFFTVTDTGVASLVTVLGTSGTNTAFRGIEIALLPPAAQPPVVPVPEPGSIVLLGLGGLCAAAIGRRRR